MAKVPSAVEI